MYLPDLLGPKFLSLFWRFFLLCPKFGKFVKRSSTVLEFLDLV